MPTTSVKLSEELKKRIAKVAKKEGTSPHAFMMRAIEQGTLLAEWEAVSVAEALAARAEMDLTGLGLDAHEVHAYLRAITAGKKAPKPKLRPWRK